MLNSLMQLKQNHTDLESKKGLNFFGQNNTKMATVAL